MNSVFGVKPVIESTSSVKDLTRSRIPLSCLLCLCELVFKRPAAMKVHAVKMHGQRFDPVLRFAD